MSRVELATGLDAGQCWHLGDPFGEQRRMLAGSGIHLLRNRDVIQITGEPRLAWLNDLTSADMLTLAPGEGVTTLIVAGNGRVQHALHGIDDGTQFSCWTEPGQGVAVLDWLERMKFWTPVDFRRRADLVPVWFGAGGAVPEDAPRRASEVADGTEVLLPVATAEALVESAGCWAFEALRIAAGVPRIGIDTDPVTLPNEIGLYATTLGKGCYPGQEVVTRIHTTGRPPRRLVRYLFEGSEDLPEPGSPVMLDDKAVGFVGSVAQHWELGPVGLGLIRRDTDVNAVVTAAGVRASQDVVVDPDVGEHFKADPKLRLI